MGTTITPIHILQLLAEQGEQVADLGRGVGSPGEEVACLPSALSPDQPGDAHVCKGGHQLQSFVPEDSHEGSPCRAQTFIHRMLTHILPTSH